MPLAEMNGSDADDTWGGSGLPCGVAERPAEWAAEAPILGRILRMEPNDRIEKQSRYSGWVLCVFITSCSSFKEQSQASVEEWSSSLGRCGGALRHVRPQPHLDLPRQGCQ